MPKISELPASQGLTGTEIIAVVQDGETRNMTLADLVGEQQAIKCRWVNSNYGKSFINYRYVELNGSAEAQEGLNEADEAYYINWNGRPFQLNGQAYYPKNKPRTVIWGYEIEFEEVPIDPGTEEQDVVFDGAEPSHALELEDGSWSIKATDGNFSEGGTIQIFVDDYLKATLGNVDDEYILKAPYGTKRAVALIQNTPFPATAHVSHTTRHLINGEIPRVEFCGDQITISAENLPCTCGIWPYASLYDQDGGNVGIYNDFGMWFTNPAGMSQPIE